MVRKTPARSYAAPSPPTAQTPFLSRAEQDLAASEQRFRLLVESVTDYAIYMLDPTGVVTNWNSGAQRFNGYAASSASISASSSPVRIARPVCPSASWKLP